MTKYFIQSLVPKINSCPYKASSMSSSAILRMSSLRCTYRKRKNVSCYEENTTQQSKEIIIITSIQHAAFGTNSVSFEISTSRALLCFSKLFHTNACRVTSGSSAILDVCIRLLVLLTGLGDKMQSF